LDLIQEKIGQIRIKTVKSMRYLGLDPKMATVYVAGKYWSTAMDTVGLAKDLGFGVLTENGSDLDIKGPFGPLKVGQNGNSIKAKRGRKPKSS
jgi:hypothetical protein